MCNNRDHCCHPEKKVENPKECSPEQIRKCHGDVSEHPCVEKKEKGM